MTLRATEFWNATKRTMDDCLTAEERSEITRNISLWSARSPDSFFTQRAYEGIVVVFLATTNKKSRIAGAP